jgi:hypothetical protein
MPDGSQLTIQATIKRATLAAHRAVEALDREALDELQAVYRRAAADIASRIAQHAGADGNLALAELRSALAQVEGELARLSALRDQLLQTSLQRAANLGLQPLTGSGTLSADAGMRIATEALEFVRTFVAEDGLQLSDRIWRLDRGARDRVVNGIEQAVIQGHSAQQAARELLMRGLPVPGDLQDKVNAANVPALGKTVSDGLITGPGSPMDNAMRLMRTEINRAHGEAYMKGGESTRGFAGWRYLLSPAHPAPDICDLLSTQNLHGLGPGVYPDRARTPWPAHPNTLSFIVMVFESEITDADRAGKETPLQALQRLSAAQQLGVLGQGKLAAMREGRLTQGMIRAPWKAVKLRLEKAGRRVPLPKPKAPPIGRSPAPRGTGLDATLERMRQQLANEVDLPRVTARQLESIAGGMSAVMVPFGIKVNQITWSQGGKSYYAAYIRPRIGFEPGGNDRMVFQRSYVTRHKAIEAEITRNFTQRREREIRRLESLLAPNLSPSMRAEVEEQLQAIRGTTRWGVSATAPDPLFSVAAHEAGHRIYFQRPEIDRTFVESLNRFNVTPGDAGRVSEYAKTNARELFAEVAALIATERRSEVPENILKAYDAAVKQVK